MVQINIITVTVAQISVFHHLKLLSQGYLLLLWSWNMQAYFWT